MKIDLLGSTSVLQQLLGKPTVENQARASKPPEFEALLGELRPNGKESLIKSALEGEASGSPNSSIVVEQGPMARYSFKAPELLTQELLPKQIEAPKEAPSQESVKTPTVLKVRRVGAHDDLVYAPKAERMERVSQLVESAGSSHGVDPTLGMAVVSVESAFDPNALSSDGHFSKGLFQLLDSTAKTVMDREKLGGDYIPYEPEQNVDLGVRYLRYLHDFFSKSTALPNGQRSFPTANSSNLEKLAVAAFNAGEGRVTASQHQAAKAGEDPTNYNHVEKYLPKSTQEYVNKVLAARGQFTSEASGS